MHGGHFGSNHFRVPPVRDLANLNRQLLNAARSCPVL